MKTTKFLIGAMALAASFAAMNAQGQNIPATLIDISPGAEVSGTYSGDPFDVLPTGVLRFTTFDAFCVEPLQSLGYGQTLQFAIQDPSSLNNSDVIARLIGGFLSNSGRTNEDAAAVQWAIWEVVVEPGQKDLFAGSVRIAPVDASIATLANYYLANNEGFVPASLVYLTNDTYQNVVTWNIPEPSTVGLAALSGLFLLRRRR